jgi:hypothetical protein
MIDINKSYRFRNGAPARVLCVDGGNERFPVIALTKDGQTTRHTVDGKKYIGEEEHLLDLIEDYDGAYTGFLSTIRNDLCDGEDVFAALIIGKPRYRSGIHFRTRLNITELDRLDFNDVSDALGWVDQLRETLLRRKIKLEDIQYEDEFRIQREINALAASIQYEEKHGG